ncbi:MAG TPA: efflux RND transporter periplasmic adaptor subunit [Candidatus Acidoferrales bacterium]|nr:efflux RND transporter periplasmic adaptor subunit [Candidatus Acidoferrales bacterium]
MATKKWVRDWRVWLSLLLGITAVTIVFVSFLDRDPVLVVQIVRPVRSALRDYVTCNGKIEPIAARIYRAQFETSVTHLLAKEGMPVHRGEKLLRLEANQVSADLSQAKLQLAMAQDDLRNSRGGGPPDERAQLAGDLRRAQADVERLQQTQETLEKLLQTHAATRDELSQNSTALARAQALLDTILQKQRDLADRAASEEQRDSLRVKQAEEQIGLLETRLESATVISPIEGTLYGFPLREGDYVRPGDVLAQIADLRKVQVRAFVDEADLGGLKVGEPVTITWDAMPELSWTGATEQIPKRVAALGSRSVGEVLCSVDNDKLDLLPNVNVDVRILVNEKDSALVVPRGAVRTEQGSHFVFVVEGDRLRQREVSLGIANSTSYEVLSGLGETDQVAVSSNLDLHDGTVVRSDEAHRSAND